MEDLFGKCGCNCSKCPAYIGNIKSDQDKEKCSEGWKKYLNINLKTDKCICLGCQAKDPWKTGNVIPDRSCLIRKCSIKSDVKTCAHCGSFPCSFVEDRSNLDYSREWVEKRTGEKLADEDYETFVETYETYKHLKKIRKSLSGNEIKPQNVIEPLKVKILDFPEKIDVSVEDAKALKSAYQFLCDLKQCKGHTSYIDQVINEKRIKPAMFILWVFSVYGKFTDEKKTELLIDSLDAADRTEFGNIVRKKDTNFHGSANQVAILFKDFGLELGISPQNNKNWTIYLSYKDDNNLDNVLAGLKLYSLRLVEKFGFPKHSGSWKFDGDAFKYFEKLDFSKI